MSKPIGVILPFRDGGEGKRIMKLSSAIHSWKKYSQGFSELYLIVDDDEDIQNSPILKKYKNINYLVVPAGISLIEKLNFYALDIANNHKYIQFFAHDIVFKTQWETYFIDVLKKKPYGVVYGNDGIHGIELCTHPFIKSSMIKAVGFYGCPAVSHNCFDNYWRDIGIYLQSIFYVPQVKMEHRHPSVGKAEPDFIFYKILNLMNSDVESYKEYATSGNLKKDFYKIKFYNEETE